MFKKALVLIGGAAVVGLLVFGTNLFSYIGTTVGVIKDEIDHSIPVEFEIKRAQNLIEAIIPEIQASRKVVAQEEVEVDHLKGEIARLEESQSTAERRMMIQKTALESGATRCSFGGRSYPRKQVEFDLAQTFESFQSNESLLESKRRLLQAREGSLVAAKERLDDVKLEKQKMENTVQAMYAQLRQVQAMEAKSAEVVLSTTNLSKAKELLSKCKKRLDVAQKMLEQEGTASPVIIDMDAPEERNIVEEVNHFFEARAKTDESDPDFEVYASVFKK